jgi:hypothetical protein
MPLSAGQSQYRIQYEISPIALTGGIASNVPGGLLTIMALTQPSSLTNPGSDFDLDNAFAYFYPIPGSSLIETQIGQYPFQNTTVAANAILNEPLTCDLIMRCPCRDAGDYVTKKSIMTALQSTLAQHIAQEGLFSVSTPSFTWANCLLKSLVDVSGGESLQAQITWKWSFTQPLTSANTSAANNTPSSLNPSTDAMNNQVPNNPAANTAPNALSGPVGVGAGLGNGAVGVGTGNGPVGVGVNGFLAQPQ